MKTLLCPRSELYPMAPVSRSFQLSVEDKDLAKYVRYQKDSAVAYGILDGAAIREIRGDLFGARDPSGVTYSLSEVKLLYPCEPSKILAVGRNYKSHLGERQAPERPEMFYKPVSALQNPGGPDRHPAGCRECAFRRRIGNRDRPRRIHLRRYLRQ